MKLNSKIGELKNVNKCICIAHNYSEDSFAGMSFHLAHYLASIRYDVLFISHKPSFDAPFSVHKDKGDIYVYSWPEKRPTGIRSLVWFIGLYLRYKPKIIIGHFVGGNITAIVSKLFSRPKTKTCIYYHTISNYNIAEWRGSNFKRKWSILRKRMFYRFFADLIICPSDLARDDFKSTYLKSKECKVVLNPLKDRYTKPDKTDNDKIVVSYLGRFEKSKGILELLNAFIEYSGYKSHSRIRLQLAGSGSLTDEINRICQKNNHVIYLRGTIPYNEVDNYLRFSDYVIIPSLSDNLPTVGIESLMNGVPLLLSTQTGLAHYLEDGVNSFLFQPSVKGVLGVLAKIEINQSQYNFMSINARKAYLEKFTLQGYYSRMTKLLNLLVSNSPEQNY